MKLLHKALALGLVGILASPACTVEFGSMGQNGPDGEGLGGEPVVGPVFGAGGSPTTGYPGGLGGSMAIHTFGGNNSITTCFCDEGTRQENYVGCADGSSVGPVCVLQPDYSCVWVSQPCPGVGGSGGATSTGPDLAIGGSLVTGSGGTPPATPVSGGTTSIELGSGGEPTGTPTSGGATSSSACPAVTLSIPSCGAGALNILYDAAGCVAGFVCLVD